MTTEPNTGAPYIDDAQAQKAATHNAAVNILATASQICVQNRTTTAPPGGPTLGQAWIVAAGGSGAWNTHDGQLAAWYDGWVFLTPKEGWLAYDRGADEFVRYDGAAWGRELGTATGWAAATGTATRTTFDTATVTLPQLAEHVKAILDDLLARKLPHT